MQHAGAVEDRRRFFVLERSENEQARKILKDIPEPAGGEVIFYRWVEEFFAGRPQYERLVNRMCSNKLKIHFYLSTLSPTEIAISYAYHAKDRPGMGYAKPAK